MMSLESSRSFVIDFSDTSNKATSLFEESHSFVVETDCNNSISLYMDFNATDHHGLNISTQSDNSVILHNDNSDIIVSPELFLSSENFNFDDCSSSEYFIPSTVSTPLKSNQKDFSKSTLSSYIMCRSIYLSSFHRKKICKEKIAN